MPEQGEYTKHQPRAHREQIVPVFDVRTYSQEGETLEFSWPAKLGRRAHRVKLLSHAITSAMRCTVQLPQGFMEWSSYI
jgi:hypothetical protein